MRGLADEAWLRRFLKELAREADDDRAVYLAGGATAVLLGWRESTIAADILMVPEQDLAKIERGHAKDLADVAQLLARGLVEPERLREMFEAMAPRLHRYPAVDPPSFRKRLDHALGPRR